MYPVDAEFTTLLCLMMGVLIPVMVVMRVVADGILNWQAKRKANRYIKRVLGEE